MAGNFRQINEYNEIDSVASDDQVLIYDTSNQSRKKASADKIANYVYQSGNEITALEDSDTVLMNDASTGNKARVRVDDFATYVNNGPINEDVSNKTVTTAGGKPRTLANRFFDYINILDYNGVSNDGITDSTVGIQNAVNEAFSSGKLIFWNSGSYLTSASINNFHAVNNVGFNALILRGSDTYHINPETESSINRLYVSPTGNDNNDGLSASEPLLTSQRPVDILNSKGDSLNGSWYIVLAAGTYSRMRFDDDGIKYINPIHIEGPDRDYTSGDIWMEMGASAGTLQEPGFIAGTYTNGETVTGSVSGFTGTLVTDGASYIIVTVNSGVPQIDDIVTGAISGATGKILAQSPIPTAFIQEGATQAAFGIRAQTLTDLSIKNVKIVDFNGSTSSSGVYVVDKCNLNLDNVHLEDCYIGVSNQSYGDIDIKGGVIFDCGYLNSVTQGGYGIRGLFFAKYSIGTQSSGTMVNAPIIRSCYFGVFGQEGCTGHLDYSFMRFNTVGTRLTINCRVNADGSRYYDNDNNAWISDSSVLSPSANTVVGSGVNIHTNACYISGAACSVSTNAGISSEIPAYFPNERVVQARYSTQNINSTTAIEIYSIDTMAPYLGETYPSFMPAKCFKFEVYGSVSGTNGGKRIQHRFGGINLGSLTFQASDVGGFFAYGMIMIGSGGMTQYATVHGAVNGELNRVSTSNQTINLDTTDATYAVEALVINASDTITIESYIIKAQGF